MHHRRYVSIFGLFDLQRTAYGSREGQKIDFVPLDNRLQLPASEFSYVLQDWDQTLCVEQAFAQATTVVVRILQFKQSADTLQHMSVKITEHVADFRENRPKPDPASAERTRTTTLLITGDERLPLPGTIITREYKGDNLRVQVLPKGFEFEGEFFKSLSAVAKAITGPHCNGYYFFRLGKEAAR